MQLNLGVNYIILGTLELSLSFLKYAITHNSFNKYLLSAYYVPGIIPGAGDISMSKDKTLASWKCNKWGEMEYNQININIIQEMTNFIKKNKAR